MQSLRRDVGAVRPADRAEFRVKTDPGEVPRIAQWLEDARPLPGRGAEFATPPVVEREAETMRARDLHLDDPVQM